MAAMCRCSEYSRLYRKMLKMEMWKNLTNNPSKVDFICIDCHDIIKYVDFQRKKWGDFIPSFWIEIFSDFKPAEPRFFTSEREMGTLESPDLWSQKDRSFCGDYPWIPFFFRNQISKLTKFQKEKNHRKLQLNGHFAEFFFGLSLLGVKMSAFWDSLK